MIAYSRLDLFMIHSGLKDFLAERAARQKRKTLPYSLASLSEPQLPTPRSDRPPITRHLPATVTESSPVPMTRRRLPESVAAMATLPASVSIDDLATLRRVLSGKDALSNAELARRMGVSAGEASKRVSAAVAAGLVRRERHGRRVAVSLA